MNGITSTGGAAPFFQTFSQPGSPSGTSYAVATQSTRGSAPYCLLPGTPLFSPHCVLELPLCRTLHLSWLSQFLQCPVSPCETHPGPGKLPFPAHSASICCGPGWGTGQVNNNMQNPFHFRDLHLIQAFLP